jgi:hypothetical protein
MAETPLQNISTVHGMGRSRKQHFGRLKPMRTRNLSNLVKIPITKTHSFEIQAIKHNGSGLLNVFQKKVIAKS